MDNTSQQGAFVDIESLYRPLTSDRGKRSFRLISLLPDAEGSNNPLRCTLHEADLDDSSGKYEALSYRWGDPGHRPKTIQINETTISITQNLYTALLHLQFSAKPRVIWVDALSINQDDIKERGQQVSIMRDIYRNASKVICWLGPKSVDVLFNAKKFLLHLRSDSLRSIIRYPTVIPHLAQYCPTSEDLLNLKGTPWFGRKKWEIVLEQFSRDSDGDDQARPTDSDETDTARISAPSDETLEDIRKSQKSADFLNRASSHSQQLCLPTERAMLAYPADALFRNTGEKVWPEKVNGNVRLSPWYYIKALCRLKYWTRLWIVQEIVLAREIVLQSNCITMQWRMLADALLCLRYMTDGNFPELARILLHTPGAQLVNLRREFQATNQRPLDDSNFEFTRILRKTQHTSCHDPRDKIYGLLGLAERSGLRMYPDYTRTPFDIYEEIMEQSSLWRSNQLVSFSALIQQQFGGLPLRCERSRPISAFSSEPHFQIRSNVDGAISVIGDAFTNISAAKTLISTWQEIYFHRILSHAPAANLSPMVQDALNTIGHDYRRIFGLQSKHSHVRLVSRENENPDYAWDSVQNRYTKHLISRNVGTCNLCSEVSQHSSESLSSSSGGIGGLPGSQNLHVLKEDIPTSFSQDELLKEDHM